MCTVPCAEVLTNFYKIKMVCITIIILIPSFFQNFADIQNSCFLGNDHIFNSKINFENITRAKIRPTAIFGVVNSAKGKMGNNKRKGGQTNLCTPKN